MQARKLYDCTGTYTTPWPLGIPLAARAQPLRFSHGPESHGRARPATEFLGRVTVHTRPIRTQHTAPTAS
eukprot:COSAG01_NODE_39574_length_474_cov_20.816000_1_plen_69_part_10